jgi:hypothetical protein
MPILGTIASSTRQGLATDLGSMFPLASFTIPSTGTGTIDFTNIPQTYKHLQIRAVYNNVNTPRNVRMTLNSSITSTYWHYVYGLGTGLGTAGSSTQNLFTVQDGISSTNMYAMVVDIVDYTNTNKNKTLRTLLGYDNNGNGFAQISSNLYVTTSAITAIRLFIDDFSFVSGSQFALYGIK